MTKCRALPFVILSTLLLSVLVTRAQVTTNKTALQNASQVRAKQEIALQQLVIDQARKKGWPLTIANKKGRMAYLIGINHNGGPLYVTTADNIISAATIRTNQLWAGGSTGLNLSGSSASVTGKMAVWDEGLVRPTHVELKGRVTQVDGASNLADHSTHVAGTMIAAGVNPVAKGMAYGFQGLKTYDFNSDESEMTSAAAGGLLVSNHSYAIIAGWYYNGDLSRWEWYGNDGDSVDVSFGLYDTHAQTWDKIAYDAPFYLIAKASGNQRTVNGPANGDPYYVYIGSSWVKKNRVANAISNNDGYDIIATYGIAKNILTVGAVYPIPGGYTQPSDVVLTDFSSWGPADDGRIKPDVVADGADVLSSVASADNAYDIFSGTSMATPAAAGSSMLLQEYWASKHSGVFMRSATLKGLIIHTADESGPYPGPDYQYGWGLIDMQKAANVLITNNTTQVIYENQLTNTSHDADNYTIVASGKEPLVATICWTDPAGTPPSNTNINTANFQDTVRKLVNDLDLRITDVASGKVYFPWMLNPKNRPAAATTGDNVRDNVEKVQVDSLIPGKSYKISITHKGTLTNTSQAYSLLVGGGGGTAYCASGGASGSYIGNLSFSGISYTATPGCKSYTDSTGATAASLPIGQAVPISIKYLLCTGSSATTNIAVYIDYNNDGDFSDAGELAAQGTGLTSTTTAATFNANITAPSTAVVGTVTRMRVIVRDGGSAVPAACGVSTAGETQDYRVVFTTPGNDVGIASLETPTVSSCASDSQIVTIRIRNFGSVIQTAVPVTTVIKNGATTVATLTAICTDSIPAKGDVLFTYNTTFAAAAGTTYTFSSQTSLSGDLNTSNDANSSTVTISSYSSTATGTAAICGDNGTTATLKATVTGNDLPLWYDSPTATIPIAAGAVTTTTVIPADKTYYLGLNDLTTKLGPPNKIAAYTGGAGAYFRMTGNYVNITTSVPLTIESAKLYVAHSGQVTFTLATLVSRNVSTGNFSYIPLYNTTIDVYATKQVPTTAGQTNVAAGDNTDTGAIFNLNIPVPTPGSYIIIIQCSGNTSLFLNAFGSSSTSTVPYPLSIPGVMSITGNDFYDVGAADSAVYYKKFYYPFYNIGLRLSGCPGGPRTAVVASTGSIATPVITLNGNVLTSSAPTGNQWYYNNGKRNGHTGQTDTAISAGVYKTVVTDPVTGCLLTSNEINFIGTATTDVDGSAISLKVSPNPNNGVFQLSFTMNTQDNLSISLLNTLGQKVYQQDQSNFVGSYSQTINLPGLSDGMYVLKIVHGDTTYIRKILVKK